MNKQTAVDLLVSILNKEGFAPVLTDEEIQQAKQIEKEQIETAYKEGNHSEMRGGKVIFEKMESYYNETYGGTKN
jgi:hypothetical protein